MKTFSIGKDPDNQIVINDNFVSRHHATLIIHDNGQVEIKDLSSSNGTYVNGVRITECFLNTGDTVKCGSVILNWLQYVNEIQQLQKEYTQQPINDIQQIHSLVLLPNENEILTSKGNDIIIILTNQRIYMREKALGRSDTIVIFLEDISSIQLLYKNNFILLILALLSFLVFIYSLSTRSTELMGGSLAIGLILVLLWFLSRRHIISIYPDGGTPLQVQLNQMPAQQIENFVNKIQIAKGERMNELFKHKQ